MDMVKNIVKTKIRENEANILMTIFWDRNEFEVGELAGGFRVGDKRKVNGTKFIYEYWNGHSWVSEENYNYEFSENKMVNPDSCDGCDEPFCRCGGIGYNSTDKKTIIKDIVELLDIYDLSSKEIRKRLAMLAGAEQ